MRFLLCLLLVSALSGCGNTEERLEKPRWVRYEKVNRSPGIKLRSFSGLTQAGLESALSFRVAGTVNSLAVRVGDKIKKGDMIASLDPIDYSLQYEETEASLMQSKAQERNAAAKYARIRDLYETRSTSRNDLDAARAESESAAAAVEAMQKKLAFARTQFGYTSLHAPQDGSISKVEVDLNENIQVGQSVVTLTSASSIEVKISIPEILISEVRKGDHVSVSFGSIPGKHFNGEVSEVGVSSEVGTTFPVIVDLKNAPDEIRPGMAAEVLFSFYDRKKPFTIHVPASAVSGVGKKKYVYLLISAEEGLGVVQRREVQTGDLSNFGLEILSGLEEEELIITAGIHSLTDGQKVRMK